MQFMLESILMSLKQFCKEEWAEIVPQCIKPTNPAGISLVVIIDAGGIYPVINSGSVDMIICLMLLVHFHVCVRFC